MAVNPGGYGELRSAQVRRVLYISIVVIVVVVVAIAGFILKRSRRRLAGSCAGAAGEYG